MANEFSTTLTDVDERSAAHVRRASRDDSQELGLKALFGVINAGMEIEEDFSRRTAVSEAREITTTATEVSLLENEWANKQTESGGFNTESDSAKALKSNLDKGLQKLVSLGLQRGSTGVAKLDVRIDTYLNQLAKENPRFRAEIFAEGNLIKKGYDARVTGILSAEASLLTAKNKRASAIDASMDKTIALANKLNIPLGGEPLDIKSDPDLYTNLFNSVESRKAELLIRNNEKAASDKRIAVGTETVENYGKRVATNIAFAFRDGSDALNKIILDSGIADVAGKSKTGKIDLSILLKDSQTRELVNNELDSFAKDIIIGMNNEYDKFKLSVAYRDGTLDRTKLQADHDANVKYVESRIGLYKNDNNALAAYQKILETEDAITKLEYERTNRVMLRLRDGGFITPEAMGAWSLDPVHYVKMNPQLGAVIQSTIDGILSPAQLMNNPYMKSMLFNVVKDIPKDKRTPAQQKQFETYALEGVEQIVNNINASSKVTAKGLYKSGLLIDQMSPETKKKYHGLVNKYVLGEEQGLFVKLNRALKQASAGVYTVDFDSKNNQMKISGSSGWGSDAENLIKDLNKYLPLYIKSGVDVQSSGKALADAINKSISVKGDPKTFSLFLEYLTEGTDNYMQSTTPLQKVKDAWDKLSNLPSASWKGSSDVGRSIVETVSDAATVVKESKLGAKFEKLFKIATTKRDLAGLTASDKIYGDSFITKLVESMLED